MHLPQWLRQLARQWSLPAGTRHRRRVRPDLEVLEERLTPSGDVLAFTTPEMTLIPGQPSVPMTVQLRDAQGNVVNAASNVTLQLSSSSASGQFLDTSGQTLPNSTISIPQGASSASFEYKDGQRGFPTLQANAAALNTKVSQQEEAGVMVLLQPLWQPITPGQASLPITLQLDDSTFQPFTPTIPVTLHLSSSSATGQFLDTSGHPLANSSVTVPAGSSSVQFEYKDSQAGLPLLTGFPNNTGTGIQVANGVSLVFTTPSRILTAGQPSGTITVQIQDGQGNAVNAFNPVIISLNSNSHTGKFLDSSGNPLSAPFLTLAQGSSSISFKYEDSVGGTPTLTASSAGGLGATQQEPVPYEVALTTPPQVIGLNQPSQPITVQLHDSSTGNVAPAASPVTVQLSSSSATGQFLDTAGKRLANSSIIVPAGSSSASFEYEDSQLGLPTLTASDGEFGGFQVFSVGVSLAFTTPPQTIAAGQTSSPITVQLQDSNGHAFSAADPVTLGLTSTPSSGSLAAIQFLNPATGQQQSSFTIPAGSSSVSFEMKSPWGGAPQVTATLQSVTLQSLGTIQGVSVPALTASQTETANGLSTLAFTTSAQTLTAGQKSQLVTLQLEDNSGHAASAPSGLTIELFGPSTQFFDASGNPLPTGSTASGASYSLLTLPANSSTVSFEFQTTLAGSIPIAAMVPGAFFSTQSETIQAKPPFALAFQYVPQSLLVNEPSGTLQVELTDQYGNPSPAPSGGVTINLSSTSSGGKFLTVGGDALASSSITVPEGASSVRFEYVDSQAGTPTLTASATGLTPVSQQVTIAAVTGTIHVKNTNDSGADSLRTAIAAANASPDSVIVFDAGVTGTINLLSALPALTTNTDIIGPGANVLTIAASSSAAGAFGGFIIGTRPNSASPVAEPTVAISGLTVANFKGTGITNFGTLTLRQVDVSNNQAPQTSPANNGYPYGSPGGIANLGTLTILDSTIADNSANTTTTHNSVAAGIDSEGGYLAVINSTITGNVDNDSNSAGGLGIHGNTAYIANSTISGNTVTQQTGTPNNSGGGIDSNGAVTLYDTIVAGNTGSLNNPTDVSGTFISLGNNLIGAANNQSGGFVSGDKVGTTTSPINPKLGPLQNNGGPTPTMAPLTGSPALGAGSSVNAPATDQRGDSRPSQGAIDIGAVELTGATSLSAPVITLQPSSQSTTTGRTVSFTATASGNPSPTVRWQVSSNGGKSFSNLSDGPNAIGCGTNTLTLTNVQLSQSGFKYQAVFTNSVKSVPTQAVTLTVHAPSSPAPSPSPSPSPSPTHSPSLSPSPSPTPPPLSVPPVLALFNALLGGTETANPDGSVTVTNSFLGLPLLVAHFSPTGQLESVTLFGIDVTFVFELL